MNGLIKVNDSIGYKEPCVKISSDVLLLCKNSNPWGKSAGKISTAVIKTYIKALKMVCFDNKYVLENIMK